MKVKIRAYPNLETRVSVYPERLPKNYLRELALSHPESQPETEESQTTPLLSGSDSPDSQGDRLLDLKSKLDTAQRPRRMALSRYGRLMIMRAGSCFDRSEETERLLLTGTLPGSGFRAFKALSEYSSYATKTVTNWLTRRIPGCKWMYVWEFQKRGALHLHLAVQLPVSVSDYVKAHFKDEWNRVLHTICKKSGVNLYAKTRTYSHPNEKTQADVTKCDKDPAKYLSKYITKNATNAKAFNRYPPKTWYQISRSLLASLKESTIEYTVEGLSYSQCRGFIEDAHFVISSAPIKGARYFTGKAFAWSAYCYGTNFNISEWGNKIMPTKRETIKPIHMARNVREVLKKYPATQCEMRKVTHSETLTLMERGLLSETELLLYIQTASETLERMLPEMVDATPACKLLQSTNNWWQQRYGYRLASSDNWEIIVKISTGVLTSFPVRTNVEATQSPFEKLALF